MASDAQFHKIMFENSSDNFKVTNYTSSIVHFTFYLYHVTKTSLLQSTMFNSPSSLSFGWNALLCSPQL